MALNISFNPVRRFTQPAVHYYAEQFTVHGQPRWRGYGKFDLEVDLDSRLAVQAQQFEYRQFIRGVVWYRKWIDDKAGDWVKVDRGVADSRQSVQDSRLRGRAGDERPTGPGRCRRRPG